VREGVGNLLGLLPVAGEIVGARLLVIAGVRRVQAVASVVVDMTTETLSQIAFTLLGLALLLAMRADVSVQWILLILGVQWRLYDRNEGASTAPPCLASSWKGGRRATGAGSGPINHEY